MLLSAVVKYKVCADCAEHCTDVLQHHCNIIGALITQELVKYTDHTTQKHAA